jgi:hypothetical protein
MSISVDMVISTGVTSHRDRVFVTIFSLAIIHIRVHASRRVVLWQKCCSLFFFLIENSLRAGALPLASLFLLNMRALTKFGK